MEHGSMKFLLKDFKIPSCLGTQDIQCVELHLFFDGSEVGYGASSYLRTVDSGGSTTCRLVIAKSRLLPAGKDALSTIRRIELTAAHLAVKLCNILKREIKLDRQNPSIKYINNEKKIFQRFVTNKVAFIRNHSSPAQWQHVASENNPADMASRGISPSFS